MSHIDSIAVAIQQATEGEGDHLQVNLDVFERILKKERVPIVKANKSALTMELAACREERRVQEARARSVADPEPVRARIRELEGVEHELEGQLWARGETP